MFRLSPIDQNSNVSTQAYNSNNWKKIDRTKNDFKDGQNDHFLGVIFQNVEKDSL